MAKTVKKSPSKATKAEPKRKAKSIPVFSVQDRNEARRAMQDYFRTHETTVQERNEKRRALEADFKAARNRE